MAQSNLRLVETSSMDKQKALESALSQIDRAFGKGSVMKLGQDKVVDIESISSGSLGLDIALGIGGLPRGRVIEIYGPESSGKTTLALHTVAEAGAQALGKFGQVNGDRIVHAIDIALLNSDADQGRGKGLSDRERGDNRVTAVAGEVALVQERVVLRERQRP